MPIDIEHLSDKNLKLVSGFPTVGAARGGHESHTVGHHHEEVERAVDKVDLSMTGGFIAKIRRFLQQPTKK